MKSKPVAFSEGVNFAQLSVQFKDRATFEINSGWDPLATASITQAVEAASNFVFSFGLQPDDKTPFNPDLLVSEYLEALEAETDQRTGLLILPDSLFSVKGY